MFFAVLRRYFVNLLKRLCLGWLCLGWLCLGWLCLGWLAKMTCASKVKNSSVRMVVWILIPRDSLPVYVPVLFLLYINICLFIVNLFALASVVATLFFEMLDRYIFPYILELQR
jgi:hypothetical protein